MLVLLWFNRWHKLQQMLSRHFTLRARAVVATEVTFEIPMEKKNHLTRLVLLSHHVPKRDFWACWASQFIQLLLAKQRVVNGLLLWIPFKAISLLLLIDSVLEKRRNKSEFLLTIVVFVLVESGPNLPWKFHWLGSSWKKEQVSWSEILSCFVLLTSSNCIFDRHLNNCLCVTSVELELKSGVIVDRWGAGWQ